MSVFIIFIWRNRKLLDRNPIFNPDIIGFGALLWRQDCKPWLSELKFCFQSKRLWAPWINVPLRGRLTLPASIFWWYHPQKMHPSRKQTLFACQNRKSTGYHNWIPNQVFTYFAIYIHPDEWCRKIRLTLSLSPDRQLRIILLLYNHPMLRSTLPCGLILTSVPPNNLSMRLFFRSILSMGLILPVLVFFVWFDTRECVEIFFPVLWQYNPCTLQRS